MSRIALLLILIIFAGCAGRERTVYKDVYIPQKCNISAPSRPTDTGDTVLNNALIIEYALRLENALKYCKGEL